MSRFINKTILKKMVSNSKDVTMEYWYYSHLLKPDWQKQRMWSMAETTKRFDGAPFGTQKSR